MGVAFWNPKMTPTRPVCLRPQDVLDGQDGHEQVGMAAEVAVPRGDLVDGALEMLPHRERRVQRREPPSLPAAEHRPRSTGSR